ncbi:unnamed protein product [Cyclocybe aegerita]|uniref:Uncharacterized protein n=1 Tax=Cyclocybe aegerita TaxID=1973307 RepID=A0A8S0WBH6_CYCAE|nr:unnamed protein product [Cyclocybe aegerita]
MDDLFNLLSLEATALSADPLSAPTLASVPTSSPIPVNGDRPDYTYGGFCLRLTEWRRRIPYTHPHSCVTHHYPPISDTTSTEFFPSSVTPPMLWQSTPF